MIFADLLCGKRWYLGHVYTRNCYFSIGCQCWKPLWTHNVSSLDANLVMVEGSRRGTEVIFADLHCGKRWYLGHVYTCNMQELRASR